MIKRRFEYIDFAKGFAILSIVLLHYSQPYVSGFLSQAVLIGGTGVHLFFVLSGFGLGLSKPTGVKEFYIKRVTRVLIPYYIAIISIFLINSVYNVYGEDGFYALLGHLFLFKMFDESIETSFGYHFWFLSTIIQFYLLFPLIRVAVERFKPLLVFLTALVISIIYWIVISKMGLDQQRVYNSFFLQYFWEFVGGMLLARLYRETNYIFWEQRLQTMMFLALAGLGSMAFMAMKVGHIGQVFNDIPASVGYVSLSILVFSLMAKYLPHLKKVMLLIGRYSYEIYLFHMIVFLLLRDFVEKILHYHSNILLSIIVFLPAAIFLSFAFNRIADHWLPGIWSQRGRLRVFQSHS